MPAEDYVGLISVIFLILFIVEVWRFFSIGGGGAGESKLRIPEFLKKKKEKKKKKKLKKKEEKLKHKSFIC